MRASKRVIQRMVAELEEAVEEKIVLIQEVNHRVKNNLQMITSFVDVQARGLQNVETLDFGNGIRKRIRAVSLVHELMLEEEFLSDVNFGDYATQLISELESMHYDGELFESHTEFVEAKFDLSTTMYLGILLNELVSNSIKHAAKEGEVLELWLNLTNVDGKFILTYSDSGDGIPDDVKPKKNRSIGLYLVNSMAKQLDGNLTYKKENGGGKYVLEFPTPAAGM
jgi:two-component sensor histidine kinase